MSRPAVRAPARLGHGRQLARQLAEDGAADKVRNAATAPPQPPAEIRALRHLHEPAARELAAVLVVIVGMEHSAAKVKRHVPIRITVANRERVHPGAVGPAPKMAPVRSTVARLPSEPSTTLSSSPEVMYSQPSGPMVMPDTW